MEWIILIFVLMAARGNSAAASPQRQPVSILPVQQGGVPFSDGELHVPIMNPDLARYGGGVLEVPQSNGSVVNLPYQTRDPKLPAGAKIGDSMAKQQDQLLAFALGNQNPGIGFSNSRADSGFLV